MRKLAHIGAALSLALLAMLFITQAARAAEPASALAPAAPEARADYSITARRFTSIPFGIDPMASLSSSGHEVTVSGHTGCPAAGDMFILGVMVSQNGATALGQTSGDCSDASWSAAAMARGSQTFSAGEARACAVVFVSGDFGGLGVRHWCKDVTVQ